MLYAFFVYNILDFFVAFIYVAVPALFRRCLYSSFVSFYMFKVLPAVASVFVSVLFDFLLYKVLIYITNQSCLHLKCN